MAPRGRPPDKRSSISRQHPTSAPGDSLSSPANPPTSTPAATNSNTTTSASDTQSSSHNLNARPPVQRLDTLKNTSSATGVATSSAAAAATPIPAAAPNTSQAKKSLRAKPRFIARRSKEERDAIAAIERERLQERNAAAAEAVTRLAGAGSNANRGQRDRGGRGSRGGRGRGGYMGMGGGAFSSGMGVDGASKRAYGLGRARLRREAESRSQGPGPGSGPGPSVSIKRESTIKLDDDGDFSMLGIKVKKEQFEGGSISSDQEDEEEGPKQDIDYINLVSSGDEEEHIGADGKPITSRVRIKSPGLAPIRIQRREHVPQDIAIKEESRERSRSNRDSSSRNKSQLSTSRKGKRRAKDVEVVKSESTWKGVYVDDDDGIKIKSEAPEDDTIAVDNISETRSDGEAREEIEEEKEEVAKEQQPQLSSSSPEKSKKDINKTVKHRHRKHSFRDTKGMFNTVEDRQEWNRHQESLKVLRDELGQLDLAQPTTDAEGDVQMGEAASLHHDKKSDRVYLFQFPSVMPGLTVTAEDGKAPNQADDVLELQDTTVTPQIQTETEAGPATFGQEAVKVEDDDEKEASSANERSTLWPPISSGKVGKLQVHESGRATLSWGGTSFEIAMGTDAHFLQDVVLARMPSQQHQSGGHTRGEEGVAMAMGQVRGKFVVTPDWSDIIG